MKDIAKRTGARVSVLTGVVGVAVMSGLLLAGSASATPADPVDDAFADMLQKVKDYGALIVGLVVAAALIFLGIKYLRKGLSKA